MSGPIYDPNDPAFLADPYPVYARLRDEAPVHCTFLGADPVWVVSRYEDVSRLLGEASTRMKPPGTTSPAALGDGPAARMWRSSISMSDPPDHTRLRRLVSPAFSPRAVASYRPTVVRVVTEALDAVADRDEMEVMSEFAMIVPMRVICGLLGIPDEDWALLMGWTPDLLRMFVPEASDAEGLERCQTACQHFFDYLGDLVDRHRDAPVENITSMLVAAETDGDRLSRDELMAMLRGLITAGFETTMGLIGSTVLGLLQHPDQLALVRDDLSLVESAVEEFLRWETPVHAHHRYLSELMSFGGDDVDAGRRVLGLIGAANRDPRRFAAPDAVDVRREDLKHLAFGGGRHFCVGANLARLEATTAITGLLTRFEDFELLTEDHSRRPSFQFRVLERLPIRFTVR